tara:strand:- start:22 stop:663 length:642 start_codon:yes stop_codon:yes gene_type:complete
MTSKEKLSVKYPIVTVMKQQMKQRDCFNANHVKGFDRRVRNHDLMMFLIEYAQKLSDENDKLKSANTETVEPEPVVEKVPVREAVVVEKVEEPEPVLASNKLEKVEFKMTKYYDYADDWETDQERISHYYSRCGEAEQLCARMYNHNYNCLPGKNDKNVADLMDVYTDWCDYEYDELSSCLEKEPTRAEEDQLQIRHRNMLKSQLLHMTKRPD